MSTLAQYRYHCHSNTHSSLPAPSSYKNLDLTSFDFVWCITKFVRVGVNVYTFACENRMKPPRWTDRHTHTCTTFTRRERSWRVVGSIECAHVDSQQVEKVSSPSRVINQHSSFLPPSLPACLPSFTCMGRSRTGLCVWVISTALMNVKHGVYALCPHESEWHYLIMNYECPCANL